MPRPTESGRTGVWRSAQAEFQRPGQTVACSARPAPGESILSVMTLAGSGYAIVTQNQIREACQFLVLQGSQTEGQIRESMRRMDHARSPAAKNVTCWTRCHEADRMLSSWAARAESRSRARVR